MTQHRPSLRKAEVEVDRLMGLIGQARVSFRKIAMWLEDYNITPGTPAERLGRVLTEAEGADRFLLEQTRDAT